jgi:DNA-binding NarL/FixJ family response regulator
MEKAKPKILIIDDEATNIDVIGQILESDYELIFAMEGASGIDIAYDALPDVILLDIIMPGMDGYDVCARLKADPRTAGIPVIFVTGLGTPEQEVRGFDVGGNDYITKPYNAPVIEARVRNQLSANRSKPEESASTPVPGEDSECDEISARQKEILEWVRVGKTNWEIAKIIGSTESNVKYHMKKILSKLSSYDRHQAANKAIGLRIIALKDKH